MDSLEQNVFFNRTLDTLAHYGVSGMKWGVWNEETRRKYRGGSGKNRGPYEEAQAEYEAFKNNTLYDKYFLPSTVKRHHDPKSWVREQKKFENSSARKVNREKKKLATAGKAVIPLGVAATAASLSVGSMPATAVAAGATFIATLATMKMDADAFRYKRYARHQ